MLIIYSDTNSRQPVSIKLGFLNNFYFINNRLIQLLWLRRYKIIFLFVKSWGFMILQTAWGVERSREDCPWVFLDKGKPSPYELILKKSVRMVFAFLHDGIRVSSQQGDTVKSVSPYTSVYWWLNRTAMTCIPH
jgi:hypothetical protein